jgi:hypothetical protein
MLDTLIDDLTFAPYVPGDLEMVLKSSLKEAEHWSATTSKESEDCLLSINTQIISRGGENQLPLIDDVARIASGLGYASRAYDKTSFETPMTEEEALYAGDLLISLYPRITSVSITNGSLELHASLPVTFFGRWSSLAEVRISADESKATVAAPWWIFLTRNDLSSIKEGLSSVPAQDSSIVGMFLRAEGIARALET